MPGGDRTGPMGYGPMTGRGAGYCAGFNTPGYMNPMPGRGAMRGNWQGAGFGRGGGRGRRNWYYATGMPGWARAGYGVPAYGAYPYQGNLPVKDEEEMLKREAEDLKQELSHIQERISTLEQAQGQEQSNG